MEAGEPSLFGGKAAGREGDGKVRRQSGRLLLGTAHDSAVEEAEGAEEGVEGAGAKRGGSGGRAWAVSSSTTDARAARSGVEPDREVDGRLTTAAWLERRRRSGMVGV